MGDMTTPTETAPGYRRVLIIGASRGLGLAFAEAYLSQGAHVVGTVRSGSQTKLHPLRDRWPELRRHAGTTKISNHCLIQRTGGSNN